jgi:hypothetical protein
MIVFISITDGFQLALLVLVPIVTLIIFGADELGYRLHNYAIFHEEEVDIRRRTWGEMEGSSKVSIPYVAVSGCQVGMDGLELALRPDMVAPKVGRRIRDRYPHREESGRLIILLRARDPQRLLAEFSRRSPLELIRDDPRLPGPERIDADKGSILAPSGRSEISKLAWHVAFVSGVISFVASFPLGWFVSPYAGAAAMAVSFLNLGLMNLVEKTAGHR